MATATALSTLDELLERLGRVSPTRIIADPAPGTATEEDCIRFAESKLLPSCELLDGTLVEKAVGHYESFFGSELLYILMTFVKENKLGLCSGEQSLLRLWTGRIRMPDIAFFPWENMKGVKIEPAPTLVPALVVEILSESNTAKEMALKRADFFEFGTRLFWVVDPWERHIQVYTSLKRCKTLKERDTLTGGTALPGFSVSVRELFKIWDGILDNFGT